MILSWRIPEDQIREYFGEKVALYFIFLAFYIKYSFPAALFGVFLFLIHLYVDGNETSVHGQIITILFTFLIVLWGNIVCGKWKLVEC